MDGHVGTSTPLWCGCRACRGEITWPIYYCGSDQANRPDGLGERGISPKLGNVIWWMHGWISFECYMQEAAPPDAERRPKIQRDEGWGHTQGLTIHGPMRPVMVVGCELCGGLRPRGQHYCLNCFGWAKIIEYLTDRPAAASLDPNHPELWPAIRRQAEAEHPEKL